jgi:hypothetical protein
LGRAPAPVAFGGLMGTYKHRTRKGIATVNTVSNSTTMWQANFNATMQKRKSKSGTYKRKKRKKIPLRTSEGHVQLNQTMQSLWCLHELE